MASLRASAMIFVRRFERRSRQCASVGVGERAAEHLKAVLSSDEGVDDSIETGSNRGE